MKLPKTAVPVVVGGASLVIFVLAFVVKPPNFNKTVRIAFVGNSMQYYNDFPRLMEEISRGTIIQNSCLHGNANIDNLLNTGNGMYKKFKTGNALIEGQEENYDGKLYDFGACTVHQLLFGYDSILYNQRGYDDDDNDNDEYSDGTNPCYEDENYMDYTINYFEENPPQWDFIVMNDNTRSPARYNSRQSSLKKLNSTYVSWFNKTGAVPVFIDTHAYWTTWRNMDGLVDIPTFTSLTWEGYRQYAELLGSQLPESQKPLIAPVGIAFLTVWEENYNMWSKMFHYDQVHASPHGSFLQACIMHYTIFQRMPQKAAAIKDNMSWLFRRARRMQPQTHPRSPFPTKTEAEYLFRVAERVTKEGHLPKSFIAYENGEAAYVDDDNYQ